MSAKLVPSWVLSPVLGEKDRKDKIDQCKVSIRAYTANVETSNKMISDLKIRIKFLKGQVEEEKKQ